MSIAYSPNMSLPVPGVGSEAGPDFADDINSCLTLIDGHDHSPGKGAQIGASALNMNANLSFNGYFITNAGGITFTAQGSTPANQTAYVSGVDLFYVDGNGNNIQITSSGGVAGTPGSITNLTSPAAVTWVSASSTFVFASTASLSANLDCGSLLLRNITPNSTYALTLAPPAALAASYTVTLPALPASTKLVTMDTSGTLAAGATADNSTLQFAGGTTLSIKSSGVGTTQLADGAVTPVKIAASTPASSSIVTSYANGTSSYTLIASATISAVANRPIAISIVGTDAANSGIGNVNSSGVFAGVSFRIQTSIGTVISYGRVTALAGSTNIVPPSSLSTVYVPASTGSLTIQWHGTGITGGVTCQVTNAQMVLTQL